VGALKIFDPELVERFGKDVQKERIRRELSLKRKSHPNLVGILDGGFDEEKQFYFVVMEFIGFPSLSSVLDQVPRSSVWTLISQVAEAARFLEKEGFSHRDIKPDNIVVATDFSKAVLLDFGVIQPIGLGRITDTEDQRRFVGTLQYSSPEFLFREEDDSPESWRALTFYQLGGVLHDLLMKRRLFDEFSEPFARLVEAVKSEDPKIDARDVSPDLVLLAKNCLVKDPKTRLKFVSWGDFAPRPAKTSSIAEAKQRILKRRGALQSSGIISADGDAERKELALRRLQEGIESKLQALLRAECIGSDFFPPLELHVTQGTTGATSHLLICFSQSQKAGLSAHLCVHFHVELLEATSSVVRVTQSVGLSGRPLELSDFEKVKTSEFFTGVFDENAIRQRLQELLYSALDRAQGICSDGEAKKKDVIWLAGEA
jgi:serine/threonine-protein kinase